MVTILPGVYENVILKFYVDFSVAEDVVWFKLATFSVFLGQVTASYEGIGTVSTNTACGICK